MQAFCSQSHAVLKLTLSEEKCLLLLDYSNVYDNIKVLDYDEKNREPKFDAVLKTENSSKYYH